MPSIYSADFKTTPYWWEAASPETHNGPLPERVEMLIVGSGFCGMAAAIELARGGVQVLVMDELAIGAGGSTRTGGMVSSGQKLVIGGAVKGVDEARKARLLKDSLASFDYLKRFVGEDQLDADLNISGRFFGAISQRHYEQLCRDGELLRTHTGVTVHEIPKARQAEVSATEFYKGGIVIDEYGGLHAGKYHAALRKLATALGVKFASHARLEKIEEQGLTKRVVTSRGTLIARTVFIATNGYTSNATPYLGKRVIPVRSYQITTEPLPTALMDEINPRRLMITDSQREVIYTRPSPDGTRVMFGARPGAFEMDEREAAPHLYAKMLEIWPQLEGYQVTHCWHGQVGMTFDKIAHMGEHDGSEHAVGCNGNGVALMTYLGYQFARKHLGTLEQPCEFDNPQFPGHPLYQGKAWFLPIVSGWYRGLDYLDRRRN